MLAGWCGATGGNGGLLDVGWVVQCDWGKWGFVRFLRVLGKI